MRFGILIFPGGFGDLDLRHVLTTHFNKEVIPVWYRDPGPYDIDVLLIPGGFPCKKSSSGIECFRDSPALNYLGNFASNGKFIVGFGNGFQLLCETGLLPGKLTTNSSGRYICKQVFIKPDNDDGAITHHLRNDRSYQIPISTYNGNYQASEEELIQMRLKNQILFRYCDASGRITESVNYTGSIDNIAGVCNKAKNIFGMIPQPERGFLKFLESSDSKLIIESFLSSA